jgi:hypothetical protein
LDSIVEEDISQDVDDSIFEIVLADPLVLQQLRRHDAMHVRRSQYRIKQEHKKYKKNELQKR